MKQIHWKLALCACIFLFACKKSNDNKNSRSTLLTSAAWKFSSAGGDLNNDGVKDFDPPAGFLTTCDTDNTVTFKSDNTGEMDEGATKCDGSDPQKVSFTWSLKNDEKDLNVSAALFPGLDGDAKILELSSSKLTVSKPVNYLGTQITVIVFFTH